MRYAFFLLLAVSLVLGCGHLSGNNPEGVTGGQEGGYGSFGSSFSGGTYGVQVLGAWRQDGNQGDYNIITFHGDGTVTVDSYVGSSQTTHNGTYNVSGSRIDINVSGWESGSGIVTINGSDMSIAFDSGTLMLQRVQ